MNIKDEMLQITKKNNGILRPINIIEFAKDTSTQLHNHFEWDNTEAAHQYRLEQARRLIRVNVTIVKSNGDEYTVKTFTSLNSDRANGDSYRLTVEILSDKDRRTELLKQAKKELASWRKKYQTLKELAPIFEAMKQIDVI